MRLSIITVNLNNSHGLAKTLASIETQQALSFEHIVIDGLSTDGSLEVLESRCYKRFSWNENSLKVYLSEKDSGIYNAMNKGLSLASGKLIMFLNSGDTLKTNGILKLITDSQEDYDVIYGGISTAKHPYNVMPNFNHQHPWTPYLHLPFHPAYICETDLLRDLGGFNERYKLVADIDAIERTLRSARKIKRLDASLVIFDLGGVSSKKENYPIILRERMALPAHPKSNYFSGLVKANCPALESLKFLGVGSRGQLWIYISIISLWYLFRELFRNRQSHDQNRSDSAKPQ
jgi:glycosyltransferase involved in cell wall biosynthesis